MQIVFLLVLLTIWLAAVIGMVMLRQRAFFHFAQGTGPNAITRRRRLGFDDEPPAMA